MKKLLSVVIILICCISLTFSQNSNKKAKYYKVWVTEMDGTIHKGFLYSANEKGIVITGNFSSTELSTSFEVSKIKTIKIRRKGNAGRTALILGGTGAIAGGGLGFIAGDDEPGWFAMSKEDKAGIGAVVGGVLGTGIGALVGSVKEKMIVDGNAAIYNRYLTRLIECSISSQYIE